MGDKTLAMKLITIIGQKISKDVKRLLKECLACQFGKGSSQSIELYTPLPEHDAL